MKRIKRLELRDVGVQSFILDSECQILNAMDFWGQPVLNALVSVEPVPQSLFSISRVHGEKSVADGAVEGKYLGSVAIAGTSNINHYFLNSVNAVSDIFRETEPDLEIKTDDSGSSNGQDAGL